MPAENLVGIHPHKAVVLADALRLASHDLHERSVRVQHLLRDAQEDDLALAGVAECVAFLEHYDQHVRRIVDDVWTMEATGRHHDVQTQLGFEAWLAPFDPAFAAPQPAAAAADVALERYRAGDRAGFAGALDAWSANPVFAVAVLRALGPAGLVVELRRLDADLEPGPLPASEQAERDQQDRLVAGLAALHATATRFEVAPFHLRDLVREVDDRPGGSAMLALLVRGNARYSSAFLVELADVVLVPLNAALASGEIGARHVQRDDEQGGPIDARVLLLQAIAADPVAAVDVVGRHDPLDLLDDRCPYGDDGAALGDLLVVAAAPAPDARAGEHLQVARKIIEWIAVEAGGEDPAVALAPGTLDRLGRIAAPHIGSFRDDDHGGGRHRTDQPIGALGIDTSRAFLDVVSHSSAAMRDVREASIRWAGRQFDRQAPLGADVTTSTEVGHVLGLVSAARARSAVRLATTADGELAENRAMWVTLLSTATQFADRLLPNVSGTDALTTAAADQFIVTPSISAEFTDRALGFAADDLAMAESMLVSSLWAHREHNSVFVGVPSPPPACLDGDRLKVFAELTPTEQDQYVTWLREPAVTEATSRAALGDALTLAGRR